MKPAEKRAAGLGVVGYLRVSSAGQTDGWSLGSQEQSIRDWAARHAIPLIAIEVAPDGCESGALSFDDRAGWQAVERHIAAGQVGWIAVAAIDRLSRNLGALADRVRRWIDQDIAIVAPAQGYDQLEGIGPFMLHIWGAMGDHEHKRLIGRVLPGMQARLQAGLPLGTQPYGYRVEVDVPVSGQRPRRHLMPDPETAPVVAALYRQALAQPDWGDRRMAAWATQQWPAESWSPGRIAHLLSHAIYAGVLQSAVRIKTVPETKTVLRTKSVLFLSNHPAIVSANDHGRLQAIRAQRKCDREIGINAVTAASWLGGIVRCGRCGGEVTWRSFIAPSSGGPLEGQYYCIGTAPTTKAAPRGQTCGTVWSQAIESFVWRAVEMIVEREAGHLRQLVANAVDQLPVHLDERRKRASADLATIATEEVQLTDAVANGLLESAAYTSAIQQCQARRTAAQELLTETDGWTYLSRLITVKEGSHAGRLRWVTLQESRGRLSRSEQRRLLRALSPTISLQDSRNIGSQDGHGEQPELGIFTGVTFERPCASEAVSFIAMGMARLLVTDPGHDVAEGLERCGWDVVDAGDGTHRWEFGREVSDDGTPTSTITLNRSNTVGDQPSPPVQQGGDGP